MAQYSTLAEEQEKETSGNRTERRSTRRRLLRRVLLGAGGGVGALAAYGFGVEPFRPRLTRVSVRVAGLPAAFEGLTIAHLSDFHIQPGFPAERLLPAVEMTNR